MSVSPLVDRLIEAFQILPGVGPKSAQRMVLFLLQRSPEGAKRVYETLSEALTSIRECASCRNLCESEFCKICLDVRRDKDQLCVVESVADIIAIEQAGGFSGYYLVLHGRLSPIDGVGPDELRLGNLLDRVKSLQPREVIVATNPTVEGEATAHYIQQLLGSHVDVITRIAHGVPIGGELEYSDGGTIVHALQGRRTFV